MLASACRLTRSRAASQEGPSLLARGLSSSAPSLKDEPGHQREDGSTIDFGELGMLQNQRLAAPARSRRRRRRSLRCLPVHHAPALRCWSPRLASGQHAVVASFPSSSAPCLTTSLPSPRAAAAAGFQHVSREEKQGLVGQVFSSVAPSYDVMNDLMSGARG